MAIVADTAWLIDVARGDAAAIALLDRLANEQELVLVPTVVLAEYLAGSRDAARDLADIQAAANVQPFTVEDAVVAGEFGRRSLREGSFPGWMDLLVAAFAHNRGDLAVVTRNRKHFAKTLDY